MNKEELLIKNKIYEETQEFGRAQFVDEIYKLQKENQDLKENLAGSMLNAYNQGCEYTKHKYQDAIKEAVDYINNATDWQWDNTAYKDLLQILERTDKKC